MLGLGNGFCFIDGNNTVSLLDGISYALENVHACHPRLKLTLKINDVQPKCPGKRDNLHKRMWHTEFDGMEPCLPKRNILLINCQVKSWILNSVHTIIPCKKFVRIKAKILMMVGSRFSFCVSSHPLPPSDFSVRKSV